MSPTKQCERRSREGRELSLLPFFRIMKPATEEHFKRLERAIDEAKALLNRYPYVDHLRTVLVIGFIDQMIEHLAAVLLLIRNGKVGSAFALVRSIFESLYRGGWILMCATDAELERFEKTDKLDLTMQEMADAIDAKTGLGKFFADLKTRGWKPLNSYTHTGLLQLGRRFTGHKLEPSYKEEEVVQVTTMATTCVLMLVRPFLAAHKHDDEARRVDELATTYGPAATATKKTIP